MAILGNKLRTRFIDKREPILFVGEGNFTFSTAFAAMRESWDGIISTTLKGRLPSIKKVKNNMDLSLTINKLKLKDQNPNYIIRKEKLNFVFANFASRKWIRKIDATADLAQFKSQRNIWFQCPWGPDPKSLLRNFVAHCSTFQDSGDLLIIGIIYKDDMKYYQRYDLCSLLGFDETQLDYLFGYSRNRTISSSVLNKNNSFIKEQGYELLYSDNELIKEIILYGYWHKCNKTKTDIHHYIRKCHVTIVLKKLMSSEEEITKALSDIHVSDKKSFY